MLEFISAPEAAKKWGISERRVQKLCEENRIPGIAKFSRLWLIPKDTEKPTDARLKAERKNPSRPPSEYPHIYAERTETGNY